MTYQTYGTNEGQVNVQWTYGGKSYYADFVDWGIQPGEILMRVFQNCSVPMVGAQRAEPSPVKDNIFLAAALAKTPTKSPTLDTSPRFGRADEPLKPSFFTSPSTPTLTMPADSTANASSSSGILPTPVAPAATAASSPSPFSFSFNKPGASASIGTTLNNPPVSTVGGFTFSATPVLAPSKGSSASETKPAEKPKTEAPKASAFAGFSFNLNKPEDQKPALGNWFNSSAASTSPSKPLFSFSAPTPAVTTVASSPSGARDVAGNDGAEGEGEDYECTAQFQPVIALPQLVETKTGEEGEEVKFCARAKLYRYDTETHEWKERGLGEMKILRHGETGKYRVLMRREQVLKICANHQIIPGLKLQPRPKPTEYLWAAPDFADGEQRNEQFVIRFKTKELADSFREVFEEGLQAAQGATPKKIEPKKGTATTSSTASTALPSLSEMCRPAAGSWDCSMCYVNNKADAAVCAACGTSNATAPPPTTEIKPQPSLFDKFKPAAGSWSCDGCYCSNKSDVAVCPACGASNPNRASLGAGGAALGGITSPFKFGIPAATVKEEKGDAPIPDPNSWKCTICSTHNPTFANSCSSCKASRPGVSNPFKFGLDATVSSVFGTKNAGSDENQAAKLPISTTFTFGFGAATSVAPQPATGFVFGQPVAAQSTVASTPSNASFTAQKTNVDDEKQPSMTELSAGFTFGSPQQHNFSFEKRPSEDEEDQVVESQDRDFAPAVASLPPEIQVVTGEEGQIVLYSQRAKLFRFVNKEWKERGVGDFKLLKDPTTMKVRLTMRRDQVHKVCLNHYLSKEMKFSRRDDRSLEWNAVDFAEGGAEPTLFAIRVRTRDIATEMLDAIHNAQNGVTDTPVKTTPKTEKDQKKTGTTPTPKSSSPLKPQVLFKDTVDAEQPSAASSSDSVEIIKEERACDEDVRRARELMLPDHFFLYESRENRCKGCRGCEADDTVEEVSPVKAENEAAVKPKKLSAKKSPQPKETAVPVPVEDATRVKVEQPTKTPPKATPVFGAPPAFGTVAAERE